MRFVRGHHGILVPNYRDIISKPFGIGIMGRIKVELIDAKTKKVKRKLEFNNLITNVGLNGIAIAKIADSAAVSLTQYCAVGTGTTAPANTDTTLVSELVSGSRVQRDTTITTSYVSGSPDYHKCLITYLYNEASANGNLTEVGFFNAAASGTMFSRQLFKDDLGTPTEVTKTSSDQLRIIYELRLYPPAADVVLSAQDISGTVTDVTVRPMGVGTVNWNSLFSTLFSDIFKDNVLCRNGTQPTRTAIISPSGISGGSSGTASTAAYVTDNFYLDRTHIFDPANGTGTINVVSPNVSPRFSLGFSTGLVKDNTKRFTLNTRISWARHV